MRTDLVMDLVTEGLALRDRSVASYAIPTNRVRPHDVATNSFRKHCIACAEGKDKALPVRDANDGTYVKQVHPWVDFGMHSVEKLV
jgi:hypothetical protein